MNGPVVVGVDGSPAGLAAVETAAWEAERRGVGLRLAHVLTWSSEQVPVGAAPWDPDAAGLRDRVNEALADAESRARRVAPDVAITRDVLFGEPASVLQSQSRAASLAVVGSHRVNFMRGRRHGSVAGHLTGHVGCPVLVVCARPNRTGPVVLADDGSPTSRKAAEFAFAEASERGADLMVVHTARGWRTTADVLSGLREKYPDVAVRTRAVRSRNHHALVEASVAAQLVVVGVRRRNGTPAVRSGSDGRTILRQAHCPVVLVPTA
jgi:nucleotide-binding universal stress UspA family protein